MSDDKKLPRREAPDVHDVRGEMPATPKSFAWACHCGRLNAPFRTVCTNCGLPKNKREEKTA